MDLGTFFKYEGIRTTYDIRRGGGDPLTVLVEIIFQKLSKDKVLLLPKLNKSALKDCVTNSPRIIASAFTKTSITDSFVSSGIIDSQTKSCTDVYAIIDSLKIN